MFKLVVLIAFISSATASCRFDPAGKASLDFNRYKGKWNLIETGPVLPDQGTPLDCIYEEYTITDNPLVYNWRWNGQMRNGTVVPDSGLVTIPNPTEQPGRLNFYLDETVFQSKVLATDYDTWAIEYTCHAGFSYERFMIRSRSTSLNINVHQTLHAVLESYGLDVSQFAVIVHDNCKA